VKKILLVEDDKTMQSLIKTLLEFEGFLTILPSEMQTRVILEEIKNTNPEAIIMDVNLRQVSGLEVLTEIRNCEETKTIKVMMSSGLDRRDDCLKAGADGFLQKPYMPDQLINWLKSITES